MPDSDHADQVRQAGLHLAELLRTRYRDRWHRPGHVTRDRGDSVHVSAVARVLADHLHDHPREGHPHDRDIEPGSLTATVSRALAGRHLSAPTLETFVAAFRMHEAHGLQLRAMLTGAEDREVVVGDLPPPSGMPTFLDKQFDTVMLHEHHWLGPDGLPAEHRSQITIRSRVDGLATYQYRIDTPHAVVEVDEGGQVGELVALGGGIWGADLTFPPVAARETHYVEFRTRLRYDVAPAPVMRRGTHELIENLDLRVQFHPRRQPATVRFGVWEHYLPPRDVLVSTEDHSLRDSLSVRRYLAVLERAVVGFEWQW